MLGHLPSVAELALEIRARFPEIALTVFRLVFKFCPVETAQLSTAGLITRSAKVRRRFERRVWYRHAAETQNCYSYYAPRYKSPILPQKELYTMSVAVSASAFQQQKEKSRRTLPGMLTASGPIFVGYTKAAVVPAATELMFIRELAWRAIHPDYPVNTSLGRYVSRDEVVAVYETHAAALIGTFVVLSPIAQARFFAELLRYIEFHRDATGLEGILTTAIQSTWRFADIQVSAHGLRVWSKYARRGGYAEHQGTFAYDESSRTLRIFRPGELADVSAEEGTLQLLTRGADPRAVPTIDGVGGRGIPGGDFEGAAGPDYRGDRGSWSGGPEGQRSLDDIRRGVGNPGIDYRGSPTSGSSPSSPGGRGFGPADGSDLRNWGGGILGDPGIDYRGSPTSGSSPSGLGRRGGGRDLLDSFGDSFDDIGRTGKGIEGRAFSEGGPFSEAFRGRPGVPGKEVGLPSDEKKGRGTGKAVFGGALVGSGFAAGISGGHWSVAVLGAAAVIGGVYFVIIGTTEISEADRQIKREDDQAAADKKAADDKAAADKKAEEPAIKVGPVTRPPAPDPDPDPKKKGESGLPDDPYGTGGGNPAWGRLDQIPADEFGGGGIGPKWLNAMPVGDDSGGIGPKWLASLPPYDDGGGGTPTSAYATSVLTLAGPGLQSLCISTSDRTMLILGMPKLANNGSLVDAGVLAALVR